MEAKMNTLLPVVPSRTFDRMSQLMEDVFGANHELTPWMPPVDIKETESEYKFLIEIPGLHKEDIEVTLSNDILKITGKREVTKEMTEENYIRRERRYGQFARSFKLDNHVRPDAIKAEFNDGILNVWVPKIEPVLPHKVKIK